VSVIQVFLHAMELIGLGMLLIPAPRKSRK
jgi:hypothetical protein